MAGAAGRRGRGVLVPPPDDEASASRSSAARDTSDVEEILMTPGEERQNTQHMKRQSRMYKKLMPYMRRYKQDILSCWEDGAHTFRLQRMPFASKDIQYTTTCGYPHCPSAHGIMEPGTLRVSIEINEHPDSDVDWSQIIPLIPSRPFTATWFQWPEGYASKGKGKEVKYWLCLKCLEELWMESTGFDDDTTDENLGLPNIGDLSILQPETRTRGPKNKLYNLSSPYVYALAKWAAVIRYQDYIDPLHESEAAQCYEGEPGTLYEDLQTLNMRGTDEARGTRIEISADLIRSPAIVRCGTRPIKFLSEVLDWVDEEVSKMRQEMAGSSRTPRAMSKTPPDISTYLRAKNKDSYSNSADEATSLTTGDETEDEDEPVAQSSVQVTPHRQRRSAFTTANKTLLKSRARDSPEDTISISSSALSSPNNKEVGNPPRTSEDLLLPSSAEKGPLAYVVSQAALAMDRAGTTSNKAPLKRRARGSPEDTSSESSSALSSPYPEVRGCIPPRTSEDMLLLSSAKKRPPANRVSRAGPAINGARNDIPNGNDGDHGRDSGRPKLWSWKQSKVMKKNSQDTLRRKSNESIADKPSQEPLETP